MIGLAPPDEKDFVKRVIAVGRADGGVLRPANRVLVDDQPLDEPYIYYLPEAGAARQAPFGPVTVPDGELWMMGDSRNNSADSRVPGHGPVPSTNVIGQARLIVMPVDRFGTIASVDPQSDAVGMAAPEDGPSATPSCSACSPSPCPLLRRPSRWRSWWRPFTASRCAAAAGHLTRSSSMTARSARRPFLPPAWRPGAGGRPPLVGDLDACRATLHRHGLGPVAGVDEAGRGACAGPLVVAACVLRPGDARRLDGLTDSKLLTAAARERVLRADRAAVRR